MIYLDHHATTPVDPAVMQAMLPYFSEFYGNASSSHDFGQLADNAINRAARSVAGLLNFVPNNLIFTSGATESNNLAILGITGGLKNGSKRRKLLTTPIEHKSVLGPLEHLKEDGWELQFLPVDPTGVVDLEKAAKIVDENTCLVSVQFANSEIGTIQPICDLVKLAHSKGAVFHCDASQAIGRVPIDLSELDIDLLSLSAHKFYGPKGIGALYIRKGLEKKIKPIIFGGDQSKGIRPGTLPVPLVVGLGKAVDLIIENANTENKRVVDLRDLFEKLLQQEIAGLLINGNKAGRLPNNSNVTFPEVDAEALLANIPEITASTGAACESGSIEPSRVLMALGLSEENAYGTIRFGFGRYNTEEEVNLAVHDIVQSYRELQNLL